MDSLIDKLVKDYPGISFVSGDTFLWSPKKKEIIFINKESKSSVWSLLHELGHALLYHTSYDSDLELIQIEANAWEKASQLGNKYGYKIDTNHIQDCLDTYRDWLHRRSLCPNCDSQSFQKDSRKYRCFNCNAEWCVSSSRLCRPYRLLKHTKKEMLPEIDSLTTFQ